MHVYSEDVYTDPQQNGDRGGIWGTQIAWASILDPLVNTCVTWASDLTNLSWAPRLENGGWKQYGRPPMSVKALKGLMYAKCSDNGQHVVDLQFLWLSLS